MSEQAEADLKLKSSRLVNLNLTSKQAYDSGSISISDSNLKVASEINTSNRTIKVKIEYDVDTNLNEVELFQLSVTYEGIFSYKDNLAPEIVESFSKTNAPAVIYPYLRSVISMATLSGGYPPLTLPIINFNKLKVTVTKNS